MTRSTTSSAGSPLPSPASGFDTLPDSALIRLPVLCALLGVSPATVWRMKTLRGVKITDRTTGWCVGDVRAFLAALKSKAAS